MSRSAPPLALDFVSHRWRSGPLGWLCLVAGLLLALWVVREEARYRSEAELVLHSRERLARQSDQRRLSQLAAQRETVPEPELRKLAGVAGTLARPWPQLFAALDAAADPQVALTRLEPDGIKGKALLAGEARSLAELFEYAAHLAAQPGIRQAQVQGYSFRDVAGAQSVSFTLQMQWGGGES